MSFNISHLYNLFEANRYSGIKNNIPKTLMLTLVNLGFMALGCYLAILFNWTPISPIFYLILAFALSFAIEFYKSDNNHSGMRTCFFLLFTLIGYYIAPYMFALAYSIPNGALILAMASVTTIVLTLTIAVTAYAYKESNDIPSILRSSLIGNLSLSLLGIYILNVFLQMPIITLLYGVGCAFLFSVYLLADILKFLVVEEISSSESNSIYSAGSIALDIINIFLAIVNIMKVTSDEKSSSSIVESIGTLIFTLAGPLIVLGAIFCMNSAFENKGEEMNPRRQGGCAPTNSQVLGQEGQVPSANPVNHDIGSDLPFAHAEFVPK
jgi:FtsH-binding integral membrane protein